MKLNFTIDTDDLYGNTVNFESLLTDSLRREIIKNCNSELASEKFREFASLAADTIVAQIKLKLEGFLAEEIALTDKWGKPSFIGSIEDLIKKQFDDVILRPVDGNGKTLQGCTTVGLTWIEWHIKSMMNDDLKNHVKQASRDIDRFVKKYLDEKLVALKDSAIKTQVNETFTSILKKVS
jgi:hypothetical protein